MRPRGRCWRRLGRGLLAAWGRAVWLFVLLPSPFPRSEGDCREGGTAASQVSDPHALLPKGAPRAPSLLSSLSAHPPPTSLEQFPCPSPC